MTEWQPIETAPKDGTRLILFVDHREPDDFCEESFWYVEPGFWEDAFVGRWDSREAGWRTEHIGAVTHWMPMPDPPFA